MHPYFRDLQSNRTTGAVVFNRSNSNPNKVERVSLRTTRADENGVGSPAVSLAGQEFTADGMDPNGDDALRYDNSQAATIEASGCIQVELSSGWNTDNAPAATKYLLSGQAGVWLEQFSSGNFSCRWDGLTPDEVKISPQGKSAGWRFMLNWNEAAGYVDYIYDELPFHRTTDFTGTSNNFARAHFGGLTTVNGDYLGERIRDCILLNANQDFTATKSVLLLGDSFTCQGGMPDFIGQPSGTLSVEKPPWATLNGLASGNGFLGDGTSDFGNSAHRDAGMVPTMFRQLFKAGIITDDNHNYAQSGGNAADGLVQFARATLAWGDTPDLVAILLGTNDATGLVAAATYEPQFRTLLSSIWGTGIRNVELSTITSLEADPTYQTSTYRDKVDEINTFIKSLPEWGQQQGYGSFIRISDSFAALGGHSIDTDDFQANNVHPSEQGSYKIGAARAPQWVEALR